MNLTVYFGNIVNARTEVIVNSWNCNFIPWFLLLPHGVSRAIKKSAGFGPFNSVMLSGPLKPGSAVLTGPGKMPCKGIIHVAAINYAWCGTEKTVRRSVESAMAIVNASHFNSVAFPVLGAGVGGLGEERSLKIMMDTLERIPTQARVEIVKFPQPG